MDGTAARRIMTTREALVSRSLEDPLDVTIVLPAFNEAHTIRDSYEQISAVMGGTGLDYEFLFVDDGSTDGTWDAIRELCRADGRVRGIRHRTNVGKANALANGFGYARGNIIATCDADLQYDPRDVLRVVEKVLEGYDAVSAYKVIRRDRLSRRLPSKFFNFFLRITTGVKLHDMNAGLKAYRRDAALELVNYGYGELHRYFMVILAKNGFSVAEVPVESMPRPSGHSKYGTERYLRGAMDFLTVFFISGYMERPLHFFGGMGVTLGLLSGALGLFSTGRLMLTGDEPGATLIGFTALLAVAGVQLLVVGLVAEMIHNLEHGTRSRAKISDVLGVERRQGAESPTNVTVERRHPLEESLELDTVLADMLQRTQAARRRAEGQSDEG